MRHRIPVIASIALCVLAGTAVAAGPPKSAAQLAKWEIPKVSFDGVSLEQVLRFYREATGANIAPDWGVLNAAGVTRDTQVKVSGTNVTLSRALDMTLASVAGAREPITWYIESNVFHITTQKGALAAQRNRPVGSLAASKAPLMRLTSIVPKIQMEDVALGDAIDFLRTISGQNVFVNWSALAVVGVDKATPVSVTAQEITLSKALDLMLDPINTGKTRLDSVYWVRDDNIITITTGAELDRDLIVRVFDVADLLAIVPNFVAPRMSLDTSNAAQTGRNRDGGNQQGGLFGGAGGGGGSGGSQQGTEEDVSSTEQRERMRNDLMEVVKSTTGADLWEPNGRGTIRFFGGRMIISQTALGYKLMEKSFRRR